MKPTTPNQIQQRDEWSVRDVLTVFRKHWKIVGMATVMGIAAAVLFQLFFPKKFESYAQMLVMRKDSRLAARGVENSGETEAKVTEELLATHMQLIQSRHLVHDALLNAGLDTLPSIVNKMTPNDHHPSDVVLRNMSVTRGGTGQARTAHVLNIAVRSDVPADSRRILKAILDQYRKFLDEKFADVNQKAAELITIAQRDLAIDLEQAEADYEMFRQASSNLMWKAGEEATNIHRVRYEGILQELAALQLSRADASARLDAINDRLEGRDEDDLTDLEKLSLVDEKNLTRVGMLLMAQKGETESPNFQAEQPLRVANARAEIDNLSELQMRERSLLTDLGASHPEVVNIRKQLASLTELMNKQKQEYKTGRSDFSLDPSALFRAYHQLLKNDILAMDRREERLKILSEEAVKLASEMVTDEIQGEALRREVQRKQELYDAAVDRLRDINLTKDYGGFINEVLAEPEDGIKVMPRARYSVPLGLLLMMFISLGGVGIAEYRDRRFRSIDDLRNALQTQVIGRIPLITSKARKGEAGEGHLPQLLDTDSRGADCFRLLRTSQIFSEGEQHRQVLSVTSPSPGDGKSTITGNLAISLGQLGKRVLIIDCDLRRPSQHYLFGIPNERGLTTVLQDELDPSDLIVTTQFKNVCILPRGESVDNPAEFLATGEFARLVDALREKYDQIFLDCPPVLPVVDAIAISNIADGVVVVVRVETTTQIQALAACSSLRHAGANLDGVIVNGLTANSFGDEYYGYGYGYYGYGYGYDKYAYSQYAEYTDNPEEKKVSSSRGASRK